MIYSHSFLEGIFTDITFLEGNLAAFTKSLKNSVLHFQEFIQGKSTLLPVLVFFLLSLYIRLMGHLTVLSVFCIFIIDTINIYSFGNQKFKKSPVNTKHTQTNPVQNQPLAFKSA